MAINNSFHFYNHYFYYYYILLLLAIPLFHSPVFSLPNHHHTPHDHTRGILYEEKTRLGSRPPSCYNKCNECHPCEAVQVPTLPSLNLVKPPETSQPASPEAVFEYDWLSAENNRYSNYKPLGWKCRCKDHIFNP